MSLMYTEEQKALIALVKEMAENEIKPYVKDARFPAFFYYYLIMSFRYGLYLFYVCFKDSSPFLSVLIYYIRIFGYTIELLKYNRLWNIIVYLLFTMIQSIHLSKL